jgi:hypothetical protein
VERGEKGWGKNHANPLPRFRGSCIKKNIIAYLSTDSCRE